MNETTEIEDTSEIAKLIVGDDHVVTEDEVDETAPLPDWLAEHDAHADGPDA